MRLHHIHKLFLVSSIVFSTTLAADDFFIYPTKNQSAEQMDRDKYECYNWAKSNTGFDPMSAPRASAPPPAQEAPVGGAGRGILMGALGGAAIGAIAGDTGKGAAIGAVGGGLTGGMRRREQQSQQSANQQQWEQQQVAEYTTNRNSYNRAYTACLEGRGYTVK